MATNAAANLGASDVRVSLNEFALAAWPSANITGFAAPLTSHFLGREFRRRAEI
jgi:hypothetical protein